MKACLQDSLEPAFPDAHPSSQGPHEISLDAARGGTFSVHLLLSGLKPGIPLSLDCHENNAPVHGSHWFRLVDVPLESNTGEGGFTESSGQKKNPFVVRRAPFRVYDAMQPVNFPLAAPSALAAFRLQIHVPLDARPKQRQIMVRVLHGEEEITLRLSATQHKARVPKPGAASFPYTNWFSLSQMASRHRLKLWSPAHFEMIGHYARLMVHGRQNTFLLPLPDIFRRTPKGLQLETQRLVRLVDIFTQAGMHTIEGGHWGKRTGGIWDAKTFSVIPGGPVVSTPAGDAFMAQGARQLHAEIKRQGWENRWIQHAADEPSDSNSGDYRVLVGMVRKYMPGLPVMDATMNVALSGSVDIWCPQCQEFQHHQKEFKAYQAQGDKIWFYTCCFPGGPWLNRLLDQEPLRPLLMGWAAAHYNLDGFLHWGLNNYKKFQDPFKQSVVDHGGGNFLPGGDTHIVYPGKDGPWSSLRLEAQREGFEDYELLKSLLERSPRKGTVLIRKVLRSFKNYSKDVPTYRAVRKELWASS